MAEPMGFELLPAEKGAPLHFPWYVYAIYYSQFVLGLGAIGFAVAAALSSSGRRQTLGVIAGACALAALAVHIATRSW